MSNAISDEKTQLIINGMFRFRKSFLMNKNSLVRSIAANEKSSIMISPKRKN